MKENLIHYRTCVCNINYHMVWTVKYRRKILNVEVEAYLQELVQEIAEDKGFTVHLFECGEGDHVHCFMSAPPKLSITAIVKYLKGISGRKLFERFPEIRNQLWKGELWNHSRLPRKSAGCWTRHGSLFMPWKDPEGSRLPDRRGLSRKVSPLPICRWGSCMSGIRRKSACPFQRH